MNQFRGLLINALKHPLAMIREMLHPDASNVTSPSVLVKPSINPVAKLNKYELQNLSAHLESSGRIEELYQLLALETSAHRNAWFDAKNTKDDIRDYLDDVARAWRLAEEAGGRAIGLQCRYALLTTSVNSLAGNIPPALFLRLVKEGVWQPAQGLAYARQIPDHQERADALKKLGILAPETERFSVIQEALVAVREIENDRNRAQALAELASHLPESLRDDVLSEVLAAASEALTAARRIGHSPHRVKALVELVPYLSGPLRDEALRDGLVAALDGEDESYHAQGLAELAPYLPEHLLREALAAVREMISDNYRTAALAELFRYLPEPLRGEVLHEALAIARKIDNESYLESYRPYALAKLAPQLAKLGYPKEALAMARGIVNPDYCVSALAELFPFLPGPLRNKALRETLAAARNIDNEYHRARALAGLAPHSPERILREALAVTRKIRDTNARAIALAGLAPRLAELGHFEDVLAAVREIRNDHMRASTEMAPHETILGEVLVAERKTGIDRVRTRTLVEERKIGIDRVRARTLVGLAPYLPELLLRESLAGVEIRDNDARAKALIELALHLPAPLQYKALRKALAVAREIENDRDYVEVLAVLVPHLPSALRNKTLCEGLAAAGGIKDELNHYKALTRLAPHLPLALLRDVLVAERKIKRELYLSKGYGELERLAQLGYPEEVLTAALALRLAELGHPKEALAAAREMRSDNHRIETLAGLAPRLSRTLLNEALRQVLAARPYHEDDRMRALAGLAPHLPEPLRNEVLSKALAAARQIHNDDYSRAQALGWLAPHLSDPLRNEVLCEALAAARKTPNISGLHIEALAKLAPHLPEFLRDEALREALAAARDMRNDSSFETYRGAAREIGSESYHKSWRDEKLAELVPQLVEFDRPAEALVAVREIGDSRDRVEALAGLAPRLAASGHQEEALAVAREIGNDIYHARALGGIALHLVEHLPPIEIYPIWHETLHTLTSHTRRDTLANLRALAPVIVALGGKEALTETFHAIEDVGRWWP